MRSIIENKKGWIRIVEAFIAVTLILAVMISIYVKKPANTNTEELEKIMDASLNEAVNDNQLRQEILNNEIENITRFMDERIPNVMNFTIRICEISDICNLDVYRAEVIAKERMVSSTLTEYNPKKLKLFVWED